MGCDIHLFVEKKINNKWETVKGRNSWYDWYKEKGMESNEKEYCYEGWLYDSRNYSLFSLLADVRNGISGWRDEPATGREIKHLSIKGLPDDMSELVKNELDDYGLHSGNWLSLKELQEIDWSEKCRVAFLVSPDGYKEYKETGMPSSWCGGSNAYLVTNEDMDKYLNGKDVIGIKNGTEKKILNIVDTEHSFIQTLLDFTTPISNLCDFRNEIKELEKLLDKNITNEDIRIVFAFDN